jgi:hypothetical protein
MRPMITTDRHIDLPTSLLKERPESYQQLFSRLERVMLELTRSTSHLARS